MLGHCFIKFRNIIINSVVSNSEGAVLSPRPSKLWGCVCVCACVFVVGVMVKLPF